MSIRMLPASRKSCSGAAWPFKKARERPSLPTTRRTVSSPSQLMACSSSQRFSSRGACTTSKVAETSARSAPWRTTSAPARPPARSCSASTTMDLPAPVSPVSTVKPGRHSISMASMMAKSRICSEVSTGSSAGVIVTATAPMQLRAQEPIEVVTYRVQQRHPLLRLFDEQAIPGLDFGAHRAVAHQLRTRVVALEESQLDARARRDDERAVRQGVRAYWRHDEHVEMRFDDRSAAGEGIGGRAGCACDDDAIARVRVDVASVDVCLKIDHAPRGQALHDDVVQRQRVGEDAARILEPCGQQRALVGVELALQSGIDLGHELLGHDVGEKAQMPAVDAEQRHVVPGHKARRIKERTVPV